MSVVIHVACRRDPSGLASVFRSCRVARVELSGAQTIRAWSPRAHATLLLRERDVAAIVTFHVRGSAALATEYAELIARAFDGVVVADGEVIEVAEHQAVAPVELAAAWSQLDHRIADVLAHRERGRDRKREAWALAQRQVFEPAAERDRSCI